MAESRLIRKGFVDSERVNKLSWFAECLYHRLLLLADDYGCFDARLSFLRPQLFGMRLDTVREIDLQRALAECGEAGLIHLYEVDGKPYLMIEHYGQRIQSKRRYPPCPTVVHGEARCPTENHRVVGVGDGVEVGDDKTEREPVGKAAAIMRPPPDDVARAMKVLPLDNLKGAVLAECAVRFLDSCEASGWRDRLGRPLVNWRAAARNFARRYAENLARCGTRAVKTKTRKDCNNADDYR